MTSEIDLSIFQDVQQPLPTRSHPFNNCAAVMRLLISLKYYHHLNVKSNKNNQTIFYNFMDSIYKSQIYDDYYHFMRFHQNDLDSILDLALNEYKMTICDLSQCNYSSRHFRANDDQSIISLDVTLKYLNLYIETMDTFHFNLMHLQAAGLRVHVENIEEKQSEDRPYFDGKLSKMSNHLTKSRETTNRFIRLSTNKFNISVVNDTTKSNDEYIGDSLDTFLDVVFESLQSDNKDISELKEIVIAEEYDTESMDIDLQMSAQTGAGNISNQLQDEAMIALISYIFNAAKSV